MASIMLPETSSVKGQWAAGRETLNELQGAGRRGQVGIKDVDKIREKSVRRDKQRAPAAKLMPVWLSCCFLASAGELHTAMSLNAVRIT